jgi:tape measure domain-containing protein
MAQNIVFKISADTSNFDDGMKKTGKAVDDVDEKIKGTKKEVGAFGNALGKIGGLVAGAFAVEKIIQFGKEALKAAAQMEEIIIRLEGIHQSKQGAEKAFESLSKLAHDLGLEVNSLTENYIQFVAGAKASGMELGKAEKIFKSMTVAIKGSGASSETASRAFTALTQMIGKGKIQAEELRGQLGEAMPVAFGIMAKSLGVTTQELDKMMASGQLLASEVLPKFAKEMENAYGEDAQKLASGMTSEINRIQNAWTELLVAVGEKMPVSWVENTVTPVLELATKGLKVLSKGFTETYMTEVRKEKTLEAQVALKTIMSELDKKELTNAQKIEKLKVNQTKGLEEEKKLQLQIAVISSTLNTGNQKEITLKKKSVFTLMEKLEAQKAFNNVFNDELQTLVDLENESKNAKKAKKELTKEELRELEKLSKEQERLNELELDRLLQQAQLSATDPFEFEIAEATYDAEKEDLRLKKEQKMLDEIFKAQEDALRDRFDFGEITEEDHFQKRLELYKQFGKDVRIVEAEILKYEKEFAKERTKETWTEAESRVYATDKTLETLNMLNNAYTQSQTNQLQKQLEQGVISQEQYEQSLRKIKRRQAVIDKAGALFNIAINTAQGVSSAAGSVLGLPLAPVIGALGAIQAGIVLATPIPYNKGTKKVPMVRGAVRGKDSVHAILTPNERVVPEDINSQPGYSALMDLAHDRKISDKEAGFIAKLATGGVYAGQQSSGDIDYNQLGKSIAKYIPHTDVRIDHNGIAVITDRSHANMNRLKTRL